MATGDEITDATTGLSWSRHASGPITYADATTACASWGGRLPTEAELVAFATTSLAAITSCTGVQLFQPWPTDGEPVWSTTPDPSNPNFHATVYNTGLTTSHPGTDGVPYICVKP
jgi:hypothetical protein